MSETERLKTGVRSSVVTLQRLLMELEASPRLGARECVYCQSTLREVLKQLKQIKRIAGDGSADGR